MKHCAIWLLVLGCAACDSQSKPAIALPQVVNFGGPVLAHPTVVAVTFPADPLVSIAEDFTQELPGSAFSKLGHEYGVLSFAAGTPIRSTWQLEGTVDDELWQDHLGNEIEQNLDGFGPPPADVIYALFTPPNVTVTASGQTGCMDFGGYHSSVSLPDGTKVAYAVVPRCQSFSGLGEQDALTAVASHEIMESATDPYDALDDGAWANVDDAHLAFGLVFGGEIADLCLSSFPQFYTSSDQNYVVQRIWSNEAARAGQDPCLPPPLTDGGEPFFQAIPQLPMSTLVTVNGATTRTEAVPLSLGQSVTIPVDLYSASPTTGPWSLRIRQLSSGEVTGTLDRASGVNGSQVHLTLELTTAGNLEGIAGMEAIGIESELWCRHRHRRVPESPRSPRTSRPAGDA